MTQFAQLPHVRLAYDRVGEGAPIVLLHGAEADRGSLAALARGLSPFAQVVTFDQRGCGESGDGGEHGLLDLAADTVLLMAILGHSRFTVFGTSLGGRIAQAVALLHPQAVERLVLCNTWPLDSTLAQLNPVGAARMQSLRAGLPGTARELACLFYTPDAVQANPALVARFANALPARRAHLAREVHDLAPRRIAAPTLLLSGELDGVVPPAVMRELESRVPGAQWRSLPGAGHSAAVQAPAQLADAIASFLPAPSPDPNRQPERQPTP